MRSFAVRRRSADLSSRCWACALREVEEDVVELGCICELVELELCGSDEPLLEELWAEAAKGSAATAERARRERIE